MNAVALSIPESEGDIVEALGRKLRGSIVDQFAKEQEAPPATFLIQAKGGRDVDVLTLPQVFEVGDPRYPLWLKHCIKLLSPFMVVQVSEVWILSCDTPEEREEFERWRGGVRRPFEEHPDRTEAVMLNLERGAGIETWTAAIVRSEGKPATLGTWNQPPANTTVSGRLVGLMDPPH